jgi:hypothetical protein
MADPTGTNTATPSAIEAIIGAKGQALAPGVYADVEVPWNCSILRWTALGDQSGSAVVDIEVCTFPQFDGGTTHPAAGDSITAGSPPTIAGSTKGQDTTLPGWFRSLIAGTVLRFILNSVAGPQQITVSLEVFK